MYGLLGLAGAAKPLAPGGAADACVLLDIDLCLHVRIIEVWALDTVLDACL